MDKATKSTATYVQFHGRAIRPLTKKSPFILDFVDKIPDCSAPHDEPKEFDFGCEVCGRFGCSYCVYDDSTGKPASFSVADVLGASVSPTVVAEPWTDHIHTSRATTHSLNDGNRDSRWRRADRAVKRPLKGAGSRIKDALYCGVDEVGHFILKFIGVALLLYAVVVSGLHYYG